jgi:hypothetical protein
MDWEKRLSNSSDADLEATARNAKARALSDVNTAKGDEAERVLSLIQAERERRYLPGNIARFIEKHPLGFKDPLFYENERKDKVRASDACLSLLNKDAFEAVNIGGPTEGLLAAVKKVVNMTNLIQGGFEKPQFHDAISDPKNTKAALGAIGALLHGSDDPPERLETFSDYLQTLSLRKWTYGTYFLFLSDPKHCTFVKPTGLQKAVEIARYPLDYDPAPSAKIYRQVLGFANYIESKLRAENNPALAPEDMIDVQSFIWFLAPTGKFAR